MKVELPLRHAPTSYSPYPRLGGMPHDYLGCPSPSSSSSFFPSTSLASLLALASVAQNELQQRPRDCAVPFLVLPELKPCGAAPSSPLLQQTQSQSQPQSPSPVSSPSHQSSSSPSSPSSPSPSPNSPILAPTQPDISLLLSLAVTSTTPILPVTSAPAASISPSSLTEILNPLPQQQQPVSAPNSTPHQPSTRKEKRSAEKASNAFSHLPHKRAYKKAPLPASGKRCSSCGTNVTPEWRSGPQGPKTLCNACGLQYAKSQKLPRPPKSA